MSEAAKGLFGREDFHYIPEDDEYECPAGERLIFRGTRLQNDKIQHRYWSSACAECSIKPKCTTGPYRQFGRWEHEAVLESAQTRLEQHPDIMRIRRSTVEHPFGTLKAWMGSTHFLTRTLDRVSTEMSLHVLAYNLKRVMSILGAEALIEAIQA